MKTTITKQGPVLTEKEVADFESRNNCSLPGPYRDFLLKYNGGEPDPDSFKVPGSIFKTSLIMAFVGIDPKAQFVDLQWFIENMSDRFPKGFIEIADDPGGNPILLSTDGPTYGKIFFFDHENEPYEDCETWEDYGNIYLCADDFNEFLDHLEPYDETQVTDDDQPTAPVIKTDEPYGDELLVKTPTMFEHPTLEINDGDSITFVKEKLGLTDHPGQLIIQGKLSHFYHLEDLGFWVFFNENEIVYSIRFDIPYKFPVAGIHLNDDKDTVLKILGKPQRGFREPSSWIYDTPQFLRFDFNDDTDTVETIFR